MTKFISENELLTIENVLADVGFRKKVSEYFNGIHTYKAIWVNSDTIVTIFQRNASIYEISYDINHGEYN